MSRAAVLAFASVLPRLSTPTEVIDRLHSRVADEVNLNLFGLWRMPIKPTNWSEYLIFSLPHIAPRTFWEEHRKRSREFGLSATQKMAWQRPARPFTLTEAMQATKAGRTDRWIFDLLHEHDVRDGFYCPAGIWMALYSSAKVLKLSESVRCCLHFAAMQAAFRIEALVPSRRWKGGKLDLSARELGVLAELADGARPEEIAERAGLSVTTVRTYIRRAQDELECKTQEQAIAVAIRGMLI